VADYRYLFYDFSTRRLIDALPMTGVSYGWEVSGVGTLSGSIPLFADDLPAQRVRDAIHPYRSKIFVERDSQLVWGGWIHEEPSYDSATGMVQIKAEESLGYFAQRFMPTVTYTGQDQLAIARSIIDSLQVQPGGDMWIVTDPTVISTVLRDRSYSEFDLTPGLQALTQLSEVINGFEFCTQTSYDGNRLPHELLILGYPQVGRRLDASGVVLEYDRFTGAGNVESFTWSDSGTPMATQVWANAETDEGVQLTATTARQDLLAVGYPLMETGETFDGVTNIATLQAHAGALLEFRGAPRIAAQVTVKAQRGLQLADFLIGDDFLVRLSDWRFPPGQGGAPGLITYLRMVGCTVTPGDGLETYQFTMADFLSPI
jgi:hypothetical protein